MIISERMSIFIKSTIWAAFIMMLFSDITAGALRYGLEQVGLTMFGYIPKVLVLILAVLSFFTYRQNYIIFGLSHLLVFFTFLALVFGLPIKQVAFGLTIFLPFVFGVQLWPYIYDEPERFVILALIALFLTCAGLLLNTVNGSMPWTGFTYVVDGIEIEGAREWSTFGFDRPSGFSRISSAAAIHCMIFTLLLCPVISKYTRFGSFILVLMGLVFAVITTNKSAVGAMLLMLLMTIINQNVLHKIVLGGIALASIIVPFSSTIINYKIVPDDFISELLLASFDDRLTATWPYGLKVISEHSVYGFGRGLSGVGTGEKLYGNPDFGVMDNFSLYLYGNFGIVGIILLIMMFVASIRLLESPFPLQRGLGAALGGILIFGFFTDAIENPLSAIFMGLATHAAWYGNSIQIQCQENTV